MDHNGNYIIYYDLYHGKILLKRFNDFKHKVVTVVLFRTFKRHINQCSLFLALEYKRCTTTILLSLIQCVIHIVIITGYGNSSLKSKINLLNTM